MSQMSLLSALPVAVLLALEGCAPAPLHPAPVSSYAELPPDYSPDYVWVLAPKACLTADPTEPSGLGPFLAPGCANALNLLSMSERKTDLLAGRRLGLAPAAPSARAAQQYIYGQTGPLGGGLAPPGGASAPGTIEPEKAASSSPDTQSSQPPAPKGIK
jgi:hypothetical protein